MASQLAQRLGVTRAAIYRSEKAEREGAITLNKLDEIALQRKLLMEELLPDLPADLWDED